MQNFFNESCFPKYDPNYSYDCNHLYEIAKENQN